MKNRVTVVPDDSLIIVDAEALKFGFASDYQFHALQWYGDNGELELTPEGNISFAADEYEKYVQPFVTLWEEEKTRLQKISKPFPNPQQKKIAEIKARINIMEQEEQPRCMREVALGTEVVGEAAYNYALNKLSLLNMEIRALREELTRLPAY